MKKRILGISVAVAWLGSLYLAYGFGGAAGMYMPDRVATAAKTAVAVVNLFPASSAGACSDDPASCGFADTEERVEVGCDAFVEESPDQAVLFVFGQSNSANAGKDLYVAGDEVINFNPHDGRCYQTQDPLLGPDGLGGSVWGRLGDALVSEGLYRRVLIAPFGIGGTEIVRWAPGGDLHVRVEKTARMCSGTRASAERIRKAQASLRERLDNVWAGPDTDAIVGPRFRYDRCHFNYQGIDAHARLWVRVLEDWAAAREPAVVSGG